MTSLARLATVDGWETAHTMDLVSIIVDTRKPLVFAVVYLLCYLSALMLAQQIATTAPVMPFAQMTTEKRLIVSARRVLLEAQL